MLVNLYRALVVFSCFVFLAGCKVAVIVVEGGEVQSEASGTCLAESVCVHEITDSNYRETFTAVPNRGWKFVGWRDGENSICPGSQSPTCLVTTQGTDGNPVFQSIIASDRMFYLMPVFERIGLEITDTVTVDGTTWAQPDLFSSVSWNEINEVCAGGTCKAEALNGYNMDGWSWAGPDQLADLTFYYTGERPEYFFSRVNAGVEAGERFFSDGWRPTYGLCEGPVTDPRADDTCYTEANIAIRAARETPDNLFAVQISMGGACDLQNLDCRFSSWGYKLIELDEPKGGWFYKTL